MFAYLSYHMCAANKKRWTCRKINDEYNAFAQNKSYQLSCVDELIQPRNAIEHQYNEYSALTINIITFSYIACLLFDPQSDKRILCLSSLE